MRSIRPACLPEGGVWTGIPLTSTDPKDLLRDRTTAIRDSCDEDGPWWSPALRGPAAFSISVDAESPSPRSQVPATHT